MLAENRKEAQNVNISISTQKTYVPSSEENGVRVALY